MTAKEYLAQARNIDHDIQNMLEEVAVLRSMAEKTTVILSGMPARKRRARRGWLTPWGNWLSRKRKLTARLTVS